MADYFGGIHEVRKGLWAFFPDCAFRMLIGFAEKLRSHCSPTTEITRVCVCVCVCGVFERMYVSMYVCMYVCLFVCVCACLCGVFVCMYVF